MKQFDDFQQWIDERELKNVLNDNSAHVNELNRIHEHGQREIETMQEASRQRIADYKANAERMIQSARSELDIDQVDDEQQLDDYDMTSELLKRMGD